MNRKEPIMYMVMGVSATIFNWAMYSLFVAFVPMAIANMASWGVTLLFAFITNKWFVFESKSLSAQVILKEFIAFATARGLTGVLEIVMQPNLYAMGLDQALLGVEGLEAKVVTCLSLVIVNYFSTKWIFKAKRSMRPYEI